MKLRLNTKYHNWRSPQKMSVAFRDTFHMKQLSNLIQSGGRVLEALRHLQLTATSPSFARLNGSSDLAAKNVLMGFQGLHNYFPKGVNYVYVLELQNANYYVGTSRDLEQRMFQHFHGNGAEWTKTHPPLKIVQVIPGDKHVEKQVTLEWMRMKGWKKVRGASWTSVRLWNPPKCLHDRVQCAPPAPVENDPPVKDVNESSCLFSDAYDEINYQQ